MKQGIVACVVVALAAFGLGRATSTPSDPPPLAAPTPVRPDVKRTLNLHPPHPVAGPRGKAGGDVEGMGFLSLQTQPFTNVFFGATSLGSTPLHRRALPAGEIELTLVNEEAGLRERTTVRIEPGADNKLTLDLRDRLAPAAGTDAAAALERLRSRSVAELQLGTQPYLETSIDGRRYGSTPFFGPRKLTLPIGVHRVEFHDKVTNRKYRYELNLKGASPQNKIIIRVEESGGKIMKSEGLLEITQLK